jgi:hypothetical protein
MSGFDHGKSNADAGNLLRGVTPTEFTGTHGMIEQCVCPLLVVQPDLGRNRIDLRLGVVLPYDV